jgi:tetrapyrrole methylase family protein/MazG family protein/ATP diphosphatase
MTGHANIDQLLEIMAKLRDPDNGCPWDLEQNFESIAPYTIEESYEVADAIARGNRNDLRDELGDLLFQAVFHAQMAKEEGSFDFGDVVQAVCEKMVRRHPHVFGTGKIKDAAAQTDAWEVQKARERADKGTHGLLDDIPIGLPATERALKLQSRAARVGFDWPDLAPVFAKLKEEALELKEALESQKNKEEISSEIGDILFVCVNLARKLHVNPDRALASTNQKFIDRFAYIEAELEKQGKTPAQSTLEEMDQLWDQAKLALRAEKDQAVKAG